MCIVKNVKFYKHRQLAKDIGINLSKIDKLVFKSKIIYTQCNFDEKDMLFMNAINQIATNVTYMIAKFDSLSVEDVLILLRKNCIKNRFYKDFSTRNTQHIINKVTKDTLFLHLLYIHNRIKEFGRHIDKN